MISRFSNLLRPGFCFRSLEELKDLGKAKLTPRIEKVSRIALTLLAPLALVGDVVMTSLGALMIVPLCYYGSNLLKQVGTSWLLLAGTPIVMLLYLFKGKVFDQAPPAGKLSGSRGGSLVPDYAGGLTPFPKPSAYPDTPLHNAIISNDWIFVRAELLCKKGRREDLQERFDVVWDGQFLSVTLLDFMILATLASVGIHSHVGHELTESLSEFGSWQVSSSLPLTLRDLFVIILLRSIGEIEEITRYGLCQKQLSIAQALQESSPNRFHETFLEILEKVRKKMAKASHCTGNLMSVEWVPFFCDNLKKNQIESYKQLLRTEFGFMPNVLRDMIIKYAYSEEHLTTESDNSIPSETAQNG